ncbi:MAG: GtrA family protein [Candidatus Margulisiibacteriota bacterium]
MLKKSINLGIYLKNIQFIRFLFIGVINTLFGYSLFCLFIFLQFHYILAALFATILGVLFNFKTFGKFVFKVHDNSLIFKFVGVYVITFLTNIGMLKIFNIFHVSNYLAGAILIFPIALLAFFLNKKFVFNHKNN